MRGTVRRAKGRARAARACSLPRRYIGPSEPEIATAPCFAGSARARGVGYVRSSDTTIWRRVRAREGRSRGRQNRPMGRIHGRFSGPARTRPGPPQGRLCPISPPLAPWSHRAGDRDVRGLRRPSLLAACESAIRWACSAQWAGGSGKGVTSSISTWRNNNRFARSPAATNFEL